MTPAGEIEPALPDPGPEAPPNLMARRVDRYLRREDWKTPHTTRADLDPSQRVTQRLTTDETLEQDLAASLQHVEAVKAGLLPHPTLGMPPLVAPEAPEPEASTEPAAPLTYDLPVTLADLPLFAYVSGPAGVGKTFWAKEVARLGGEAVVLAATTGIASVNLGEGTTINALLRYFDTASLRDAYTSGFLEATLKRLRGTGLQRILLDEVSMLHGEQLTILSRAIDNVNADKPEGAPELGLILLGDFCQLAPVPDRDPNDPTGRKKRPVQFAFEAAEWERYGAHHLKLTTIRRQADRDFVEALQATRRGAIGTALGFFADRFQATTDMEFPGPTIVAKNEAVSKYNQLRLDAVTGARVSFRSERWGKVRPEWGAPPRPPAEWGVPEVLELKIGARVMILANLNIAGKDEPPIWAYTNGDLGTLEDANEHGAVVRLDRTDTTVRVGMLQRFNEIPLEPGRAKALRAEGHTDRISKDGKKEYIGGITYVPLRLAYATTVHKCVTGDTRVLVEKRGSIRVDRLHVGDWVDTGSGPARVIAVKQTLQKLCVLETARGYRVTCSADHRWKTPDRPDGFLPLRQLLATDRVMLTPEARVQGTNEIDRDTAWWIGVMVGDGNWADRREGAMHFTSNTPALRDRWMKIAQKLGGRPNTRRDLRGCHLTSLPLRLRLAAWGCAYVTAVNKRVPGAIWQSGPTAWAACLQGLFDADGSAKRGRIVYCTRSHGLADDIQLLLLYLGVPSTTGTYPGRTGPYYQIRVSAEGRARFVARVGASHPEKRAALRAWKPNRELKPYDGTDTVKAVTLGTLPVPMYDIELETIHELGWGPIMGSNSQGLSLERVQVNIRDAFFAQPGMLYVALSRARSAEGLRLVGTPEGFRARCTVNPKLKEFL